MNILVAGGLGFIGSHLVPKLKELGHKISAMDIKHGYQDDIRCHIPCLVVAHEQKIDCVVHLAALTSVQDSIENVDEYNDTNVNGTVNLLRVSQESNIKRFIFASSAAAENPTSPYGLTKLCGEQWCELFNKCYGLSTMSLRFFNVYGNGTDKGVIPTWIKAINDRRIPVVYGGQQTRDFVYIDDVVDAIVCAIDSNAVGVCEVGTGKSTSIDDLLFLVYKVMGKELSLVAGREAKENEIQDSRARHLQHTKAWINWKPKYNLERGLREMLK